jgi:Transposase DDE domain
MVGELGCLWRGADGKVTEGTVPGNGTVVIGAVAGAYAPGIGVAGLAAQAAPAGGLVTGGAGAGLLSAVLTPARIGVAVAAAGVPARAVRSTSAVLTAEVLLAAPFARDKSMAAVWRAVTARGRETDPGYDPPARSSVSDASHFLGVRVPAFLLAAVIGAPPPPAGAVARPSGAAGERGMSGPVTCGDDRGWSGGRWHGRRVLVTDGTHFALRGKAGASANWQHFGSAAGSRPLAQMVAVTDAWTRADVAVAAGKDSASEAELSAHLLPAFGPGTVGLADRGFPSHQAALAMRAAGADFVWRVSSAWKLARCGKPLSDGTYLTRLTFRGRSMKARVVEFRIDFLTRLPAGHPLLTSPGGDATVTVISDAGQPAAVAGLVTVQVSQTFTLITSLTDIHAFPAEDIAALYGDRWTIELVFFDLKVTVLGAGTQCRSPHPGGVYPEILYALAGQHALRLIGHHCAVTAGLDVPAGRLSCAALRAEIITSIGAGHGSPALLPGALAGLRTAVTRHPSRWTVPHRPGRHYPRYTIKKIRSRKPGDIVAAQTRLHMLPLTEPAPAEVTARPG